MQRRTTTPDEAKTFASWTGANDRTSAAFVRHFNFDVKLAVESYFGNPRPDWLSDSTRVNQGEIRRLLDSINLHLGAERRRPADVVMRAWLCVVGKRSPATATAMGPNPCIGISIRAFCMAPTVSERKRMGSEMAAAALRGDLAQIYALLFMYADVDVADEVQQRETPLIHAAKGGHIDIVRLLLDRGAAIDAKDRMGRTALLFAAGGRRGEEDDGLDGGFDMFGDGY